MNAVSQDSYLYEYNFKASVKVYALILPQSSVQMAETQLLWELL